MALKKRQKTEEMTTKNTKTGYNNEMTGQRHLPPPPPPPLGPQEAPSGRSKIISHNSNPFHPLIVNRQLQLDFSVFTEKFLLWNYY